MYLILSKNETTNQGAVVTNQLRLSVNWPAAETIDYAAAARRHRRFADGRQRCPVDVTDGLCAAFRITNDGRTIAQLSVRYNA